MTTGKYTPQLISGRMLEGLTKTKYEILRYIGGGQAGETYIARVAYCPLTISGLESEANVIIKYPLMLGSLTATQVRERLARLNYLFDVEGTMLDLLGDADCVARLLDRGYDKYWHRGAPVQPTFLVQQFIEGRKLSEWAAETYPGSPDGFRGIPDATIFFTFGRKLAFGLRWIHRRLVIHGDIWPENILVGPNDDPVFIDFGQALFREAVADPFQIPGRNVKYQAPEGVRSVGGDVYSIGAVLFFLATGQDPPSPVKDIDVLKSQLSQRIQDINPELYASNCGVVDIIARCLRYSDVGRIRHAESLIEDLAAFAEPPQQRALLESVNDLNSTAQLLHAARAPLFQWMAGFRVQAVAALIADMTQGVYDLSGEHEEIVTALTQYVNFLGPGDEYLTVTIPQFWWPQNMGINGRFVAITKVAAHRGATIRRIFAVSEEDRASDPWLLRILEAQVKAVEEIGAYRTGGRYEAQVLPVSVEQRKLMLSDGTHFGILVKGEDAVAIYPRYREDGLLTGVQFRTGSEMAVGLREEFELFAAQARPLEEYCATFRATGEASEKDQGTESKGQSV